MAKSSQNVRLLVFLFCFFFFIQSLTGWNEIEAQTAINLKVARETLNGYSYQVKTDNSVKLSWTKVPKSNAYTLEMSNSEEEVISSWALTGSRTNYTVTNLQPETTYYFRLYAKTKDKVISKSKRIKVKTFSKTTGFFYDKVVVKKEWPGILITQEKATDSQINSFNNTSDKAVKKKPAIKFNFVTSEKKLYINAFVKLSGTAKNDKFENYKFSQQAGKYVSCGTTNQTYEELVLSGIRNYWSVDVKGTDYDFAPGVNFSTEINLIEKEIPNQSHILIYVGVPDSIKKSLKDEDIYWAYCASCIVYLKKDPEYVEYNYLQKHFAIRIVLPSQDQIASNPSNEKGKHYPPKKSEEAYFQTVAHEFGHALGLGDAYPLDGISRCVYTEETGIDKAHSLMSSGKDVKSASSNDIEMALIAQGMALNKEKNSWQAFANYTNKGHNYKKSKAIRLQGQ